MSDLVLLEKHDAVAVLTINNAEEENILTEPMIYALQAELERVAADAESIRALILTAAGHEVFIIGADPREVVTFDAAAAYRSSRRGQALADQIERMPMPVIAAVNGLAIGGGLEMMLACDLAIASSSARFIQLETGIGLIPGFGGTYRLPRRVGVVRSKWMIYSATPIDAQTALDWTLINAIAEPQDLQAKALDLAKIIAANDGPALRLSKSLLDTRLPSSLQDSHELEAAAFSELAGTEALRSRVTALMAARAARTQN